MSIAFVYPGQGSQFVGMGKDLFDNFDVAKDIVEKVSGALNQDLKSLMFDGEAEQLNLTENTQPALLCVSMMAQKVLEKELGFSIEEKVKAVAGHSLGEYSALTAAGCFNIEDSARLVKKRGQYMQEAVPVGAGSMAAILGLNIELVEEIINGIGLSSGVVEIANDNSPGQVVISGQFKAVEEVIEKAKEKGAKRAVLLPVSAPFHSSFMALAAKLMKETLLDVSVNDFKLNVYSNVTANCYESVDDVKKLLVEQITGRVRWVELINNMYNSGIETFVEIGAGKVLSGLIKRILPNVNVYNFGCAQDLNQIDFIGKTI